MRVCAVVCLCVCLRVCRCVHPNHVRNHLGRPFHPRSIFYRSLYSTGVRMRVCAYILHTRFCACACVDMRKSRRKTSKGNRFILSSHSHLLSIHIAHVCARMRVCVLEILRVSSRINSSTQMIFIGMSLTTRFVRRLMRKIKPVLAAGMLCPPSLFFYIVVFYARFLLFF